MATAPSVEDEVAANLSGLSLVEEVIEEDKARRKCYFKIVEQPVNSMRYRYEGDGGAIIEGVNSSPQNRTYPTIEIGGWKGPVVVVVSLVTIDEIPKPHPHKIVDKDKKIIKNDPRGTQSYEFNVDNETITHSFKNLRIQQVTKKGIKEALKERKRIKVDPFRTGFAHSEQSGSINLNAVKLCFQVFVEKEPNSNLKERKFKQLMAVVSTTICNIRNKCNPTINSLSHYSATVSGGLAVTVLCGNVLKDDILVCMFEIKDEKEVWREEVKPTYMHYEVAMIFETPPYWTQEVEKPVEVFVQLKQPSIKKTGNRYKFQLTPLHSGYMSGEQMNIPFKKQKIAHEHEGQMLTKTLLPMNSCLKCSLDTTEREGGIMSGMMSRPTTSPMDYNTTNSSFSEVVTQTNTPASPIAVYPSKPVPDTSQAPSHVSPSTQAALGPARQSAQGVSSSQNLLPLPYKNITTSTSFSEAGYQMNAPTSTVLASSPVIPFNQAILSPAGLSAQGESNHQTYYTNITNYSSTQYFTSANMFKQPQENILTNSTDLPRFYLPPSNQYEIST